MTRFNLLPTRIRSERVLRARARAWTVVCTACAGVAVLITTTVRLAYDARSHRLSRLAHAAHVSVVRHETEARRLATGLEATHRALTAAERLQEEPDWSIVLALVARISGENIAITSFGLLDSERSPDRSSEARTESPAVVAVTISGVGSTHADVAAFVIGLDSAGLFSVVELERTSRTDGAPGGLTSFSVRCEIDRATP